MVKKIPVIKKKIKKFNRHHSDRYKRLKKNWRKPKGIDSCVRRRFKGRTLMPNIGYGSDKRTKNFLKNGLFKVKIENIRELKSLAMSNKKISIEISKRISSFKKKKIVDLALIMDIKINNPLILKKGD
ncbi:rpl32 (nucleomorph) [Hemiselmis andersenii]|uniref:Rpl32 n=1 Tax=Hemiselmis andersenii TaxID=464988 RepID=A9BKG8_HEMAN|nr:rpl32 [Hemiselmis andersenii]ABW98001.1 rpl32 [Hemiselmis andersenii]|mmetsp:Transcript_14740/g.34000  ORF Transcript_14740/g.34000 Transcript_14740/m.34000 type:complete len:128 (+) Transcript_14740:215-598(+)